MSDAKCEVTSYEKVDFPSLIKEVNGNFVTLDDVRRISELLITRLQTRKAPLKHVASTGEDATSAPTTSAMPDVDHTMHALDDGVRGSKNANARADPGKRASVAQDSLFNNFANKNSPGWLMAEHALSEGYAGLAEVILSQEKQCWENVSMFFLQTPGVHTYSKEADDFLSAPPHLWYYLKGKWVRFRERCRNPEKFRTPHCGATDNLPTMSGNKVFAMHAAVFAVVLALYILVADACARAKPGDYTALRCLEAESFTSQHVPNVLVTSLPVFFAVFTVNSAFQHFRRTWTQTYRFGEELSEILTQFLIMSSIEVNLFKAKVVKKPANKASASAAASTNDVKVSVSTTSGADGAENVVSAGNKEEQQQQPQAQEEVEEQVVMPSAILANNLEMARYSALLAIFLYHSLNPITYNIEAFVPFMIERYGLCEYGLMDAIDWHRWIQPRILANQKHNMLWRNHAFSGRVSQLHDAQHWGSAVTQWASEGVLDVIMRGRHLAHTNDPPIVSFNIKTWQDLVVAKNELVAEQAKLLPKVLYYTMWTAILFLFFFQFIKQSTACGNALARTGASYGGLLWATIPGTQQPFHSSIDEDQEYTIDATQAALAGFSYMFLCYFFFTIVRMVLDLLDPVAADADSVPIMPLLDSTLQRLFNRVILRCVTVMVRQEAFEEQRKARSKDAAGAHKSGAQQFSSPLATLQLRPDETERVRNRRSLQDLGDAQVQNNQSGWTLRTFDGLPAPFPQLKACSGKTRHWVRAVLGAKFASGDDDDLEAEFRSGRLGKPELGKKKSGPKTEGEGRHVDFSSGEEDDDDVAAALDA